MRKTATNAAPSLKTPFQLRKEERDRDLRKEYAALMAENPGRSKMMVKEYLKEKYSISSDDAYYKILRGG